MMSNFSKITCISALALWALHSTALGAGMPRIATPFNPENAIIDTNIPFSIGARQAEQALRNSFGWATFQEGFVNGIYFRFDPDGYARFSRSPRLEQDVFEVICPPRQYLCYAQKDGLILKILNNNYLQITVEGIAGGDRFFFDDGISELEMPASIFEPLKPQTENLLASGGKLVIRRNNEALFTISLSGFEIVSAYLRWVAAGQNYSALPQNWPIPNHKNTNKSHKFYPKTGLQQPGRWQVPVEQTQQNQMTYSTLNMDAITPKPVSMTHRNNDKNFEMLLQEITKLREEIATPDNNQQARYVATPHIMPNHEHNKAITSPQEWRARKTGTLSNNKDDKMSQLVNQMTRLEFNLELLRDKMDGKPPSNQASKSQADDDQTSMVENTSRKNMGKNAEVSFTQNDLQMLKILFDQIQKPSLSSNAPDPHFQENMATQSTQNADTAVTIRRANSTQMVENIPQYSMTQPDHSDIRPTKASGTFTQNIPKNDENSANFTDLLIMALLDEIEKEINPATFSPTNNTSLSESETAQQKMVLLRDTDIITSVKTPKIPESIEKPNARQKIVSYIPLHEYIATVFD